jgi:2-haloacid dehalogenase
MFCAGRTTWGASVTDDFRVEQVTTLLFDVLGTVVDESGTMLKEYEATLGAVGIDPRVTGVVLDAWSARLREFHNDVREHRAAWRANDALGRLALERALADAGVGPLDPSTFEVLATVGHRLQPWPDSVGALKRLRTSFSVVALSNADVSQLVDMFSSGGLSWHFVVSAEAVKSYKPDRAVYQMAIDALGLEPAATMMVAAHAWDLHAASQVGLRTAYVDRSSAGEPHRDDGFDVSATSLHDLARRLT